MLRLKDILADDPTEPRWEEWQDLPAVEDGAALTVPPIPGFRVQVRLLDVPASVAVLRASEAEDKLMATVAQAVTSWEGLTVGGVKQLLGPARFKSEVAAATPFPYDRENLEAVLARSFLLVNWVLRVIELRRRESEDLEKNSLATPGTTLTRRRAPARAAGGKKKSSA